MNKLFFIIIVLASLNIRAIASPMLNFMWSEASITTEGGTQLTARADKFGSMLELNVSKNNWSYSLSKTELNQFKQVSLNDLKIFEEPNFDYALIVFRSGEFDSETGNLVKEIEWSLTFKTGKLEAIKSKVVYEK